MIKNKQFITEPLAKLLRASSVDVILTNNWCPQWHAMQNYLAGFAMAEVFYFEYDRCGHVDEFRKFKERIWGNDQIPYVRYLSKWKTD